MSKFQPMSFADIGAFLDYLPEDERELVEALRVLIRGCMPEAEERLAYNVPFYYGNARIVFLWPGAVPWGGLREAGVQLGFCRGNVLPSRELLDQGTRREVHSLHFRSVAEIDIDLVRALLFEALEIDRMESARKIAKKRTKKADLQDPP
jgi:hypothetical protein